MEMNDSPNHRARSGLIPPVSINSTQSHLLLKHMDHVASILAFPVDDGDQIEQARLDWKPTSEMTVVASDGSMLGPKCLVRFHDGLRWQLGKAENLAIAPGDLPAWTVELLDSVGPTARRHAVALHPEHMPAVLGTVEKYVDGSLDLLADLAPYIPARWGILPRVRAAEAFYSGLFEENADELDIYAELAAREAIRHIMLASKGSILG